MASLWWINSMAHQYKMRQFGAVYQLRWLRNNIKIYTFNFIQEDSDNVITQLSYSACYPEYSTHKAFA